MHGNGAVRWREVVEKHHATLVNDLASSFETDLNSAVSAAVSTAIAEERAKSVEHIERACAEASISQVEGLNQVLRRLRAASEREVLELLARSAAAEKAVVLLFENGHARIAASHGVSFTPSEGAAGNPLQIEEIPAIISAIESKDPVVALATAGEISPELARLFEDSTAANTGKAYLFPIVARQSVMAMLVASGVRLCAPVELLCEAVGMRLESIAATAARVPESAPSDVPASETAGPRSWNDLTPEDQKLHLQAQRTARVRVAEMRLSHQNALQSGAASSDIYSGLQRPIDKAREEFLRMFLSKSPTMVDYLHLEIVRSLAHDDDRLLGSSYPGPMV
jgi:hypothetical protein